MEAMRTLGLISDYDGLGTEAWDHIQRDFLQAWPERPPLLWTPWIWLDWNPGAYCQKYLDWSEKDRAMINRRGRRPRVTPEFRRD